MRNAIDKALAERDANIDKFCTHLDKDIAELGKEVKEVKQEAQVRKDVTITPLPLPQLCTFTICLLGCSMHCKVPNLFHKSHTMK